MKTYQDPALQAELEAIMEAKNALIDAMTETELRELLKGFTYNLVQDYIRLRCMFRGEFANARDHLPASAFPSALRLVPKEDK